MSEIQETLQSIAKKYMEECYSLGKVHGAILELEKIKAEIQEVSYDRLNGFNGGQIIVEWEDIEDIFYKYISELKGENK